jgi:hypothetical protein
MECYETADPAQNLSHLQLRVLYSLVFLYNSGYLCIPAACVFVFKLLSQHVNNKH